MMRDPGQLKVVAMAEELASEVYDLTVHFSDVERYGLTSQIRRASVSIAANLVEGCSRSSTPDFRRFVEISQGSAMELRFLLGFAWRKKDIVVGDRAVELEETFQRCWRQTDDIVRGLINLRRGLGSRMASRA